MSKILKLITVAIVTFLVGIAVAGLVGNNQSTLGGSTSDNWGVGGDLTVTGSLTTNGAFAPTAITSPAEAIVAADTLTSADYGKTVYFASTTGYTITLPAATIGASVKFVVNTAFGTSNMVIDSAEGDNIEGSLIVAGAVVECDAEDQVNFVNDGENLGDFVQLDSDGTNWYITGSGALTAAKLTCTDPS